MLRAITVLTFRNGPLKMMRALLLFRVALYFFAPLTLLSILLRASVAAEPAMTNPLLTESTLPYHLPPFAAIKDEQFSPAFEQGMAENLQEVDAIAGNPAAAT